MDISELAKTYFSLTPYEKRAFLLVTNLSSKKYCSFCGKIEKFSVEYFYKKLIKDNKKRVERRKKRKT